MGKMYKIINNILRIIIILVLLYELYISNYNNSITLLLAFVLTYYNYIVKHLFKINLKESSKIMICILILLALVLGTVLKFYYLFTWWDLLLHFLSGIIMFYIGEDIFLNIVSKDKKVKINYFIVLIFSVCFALAIANIWEIFEYTTDYIFNGDTQRTAGLIGRYALEDTMTDLIISTIGTFIIFIVSYIIHKKKNHKN